MQEGSLNVKRSPVRLDHAGINTPYSVQDYSPISYHMTTVSLDHSALDVAKYIA